MSVFTKILAGDYDNQLHWPILGTVTYKLLNQWGDNNHYGMVSTLIASNGMTVGTTRGKFKYIPHSSLGHNPAINTQYLLDNTLYFRVSVKVDNIKPWLVCTDCNTNRATENSAEVILRIAK